MLARGILGSGQTRSVSFQPFPNSSGWWWLISSVFLIRISCHKTTHANGCYGAWPGWVVSISVLPLTVSSCVTLFSSCPQLFPASGTFPKNQLFASGGQSIRASASASVLPNIAVGIVIMVWLGGQSPTPVCPRPPKFYCWNSGKTLSPREPWRGLTSLLRTDLLLDPPTPESQKGNPPLPSYMVIFIYSSIHPCLQLLFLASIYQVPNETGIQILVHEGEE